MTSIQVSIELDNQITNVLYDIANAANYAASSLYHMQQSINENIDTSSLEVVREKLNQTTGDAEELNAALNRLSVPDIAPAVSGNISVRNMNTDLQGQADSEIPKDTNKGNSLWNTVKGAAAEYANLETAGKILNISDEFAQTTSQLNMINDGMQSTQELTNMVYAAAQETRGSFSGMADVVAGLGNNAKGVFGSSAEVVDFAGLAQKQMAVDGMSDTEAPSAMMQLSQALGTGVLHGEELNSIFGQSPGLIQSIADYMNVPIDRVREMASEGGISADVIKNAIFSASDDINAKFSAMTMTFGQVWQGFQNTALIAFQPVLQRLNELANSEAFQTFVNGAMEAMGQLADIVLNIFDTVAAVGSFIADNWSIISPIVFGLIAALGVYLAIMAVISAITAISAGIDAVKAAASAMAAGQTFFWTVQQYGLNSALLACPLTWIILLIIALIAIIFAVCSAIAKMTGAANSGFGVMTGGINVVIQFFKNLGMTIANIVLGIVNAIMALCSNMKVAFHNAICSVQSWFYSLLSTALTVVAGICEALNKLPFVEIDYSGISSAADNYAAKSAEAEADKESYTSVSDAFNKGMSTFDAFSGDWASDAFQSGASWGDGVADKFSNFGSSDIFKTPGNLNPDDYMNNGSDNGIQNTLDDTGAGNNLQDTLNGTGAGSGMTDALNNTGVSDNIGSIADNTGNNSDAMDITSEDLKYLRDIAETEAVNRYTVAEVSIDQSGMRNTIRNGSDLTGFMSDLTDSVNEAVDNITEGVHK